MIQALKHLLLSTRILLASSVQDKNIKTATTMYHN